jgi:hypothetical protein
VPLVLVISNPSNYYSHFVFVLALLADAGRARPASEPDPRGEPSRAVPLVVPFQRVALPLLALCIGGYWAAMDPDLDRHFQDETMLLFLALAWLYATLLRADPHTAAILEVDHDPERA